MNKLRLKGAVSIEAAFIIPIIITLLLAIIEVVNYAADRLVATNILADELQLARTAAMAIQADANLNQNTYAVCSANVVTLRESSFSSELSSRLRSQFAGSTVTTNIENFANVSFQTYVVSVSIPARPILLPDLIQFPINVTNIVTWDLSC